MGDSEGTGQQQTTATSAPKVSIVFCLWSGFRPSYTIDHVRALSRQLHEYAEIQFKLVLLTDDMNAATAEQAEVDAIYPIPEQPPGVVPGFGSPANCWRRLRLFDPTFSSRFGTEWVLSLDLDSIILAPLGDLLEYMMGAPTGLAIIRGRFADAKPGARPYNGGMYAIRVGTNVHVWDSFSWKTSPDVCRASGWVGSDQVWLGITCPGARTVGPEHGVYFAEQYRDAPPDKVPARIITFAGYKKPWSKTCKRENPEYWAAYQRFTTPALSGG